MKHTFKGARFQTVETRTELAAHVMNVLTEEDFQHGLEKRGIRMGRNGVRAGVYTEEDND